MRPPPQDIPNQHYHPTPIRILQIKTSSKTIAMFMPREASHVESVTAPLTL